MGSDFFCKTRKVQEQLDHCLEQRKQNQDQDCYVEVGYFSVYVVTAQNKPGLKYSQGFWRKWWVYFSMGYDSTVGVYRGGSHAFQRGPVIQVGF